MYALLLALPLSFVAPQDSVAAPNVEAPVYATADASAPHGVLRYRVVTGDDRPVPCRLTFVNRDGSAPTLFPGTQAAPHELAVRENVVYTLSGVGAITVPVGTYSVYASRGMEWSIAADLLTFVADEEVVWAPRLEHEVPTVGWVGGDCHLHTLTHSGHGDSNMEERVISLIGEGLDFAVATDHNHHTDYAPVLDELGATGEVHTLVGNEVSTPVGHFNTFPVDVARTPPGRGATDANELFRLLREETNQFGVVPVIQLNHPRWGGIDYFTQVGLDPVTGLATRGTYSDDFDTIEVLNGNTGWGYYDADTTTLPVGPGIHSVLRDWYNLLNRGHRYFAVGNSDSHTVRAMTAGYPRNYVACDAARPGDIQTPDIVEGLRSGRVFTTTGPFVEFRVNGAEMGSETESESGRVLCYVRVRTPQWILVNRVKFVVNGDVRRTVTLEPQIDVEGRISWPIVQEVLALESDSWVHAIVEGDEPLEPLVTPQERPILPLAITNPVWVKVKDYESWMAPYDQARLDTSFRSNLDDLWPTPAAMLVQAAVEREQPNAATLVHAALASRERLVRLAGLRGAEVLAKPHFAPACEGLFTRAVDPMMALAAARALAVCAPSGQGARLVQLFERFGSAKLARYPRELDALLTGAPVVAWQVLGPFDDPDGAALFTGAFGPLADPAGAGPFDGKGGALSWQRRTSAENGYLDLSPADAALRDHSVSYARAWLLSPDEREVLVAAGSDDGMRLWIGGAELCSTREQRGAAPLQHVERARLHAGANEVLFGVQNGGGATGLYFRVLDDAVTASAERP
ncbi:MAG: PHP domain-containing protein [Planctomycetes bacterium]|nr:PHP domain-containing protein [Planctomycetota bacterium]